MKLDIGSGLTLFEPDDMSWRRLDLNPAAPLVDYICDAFGPLPMPDNEFEHIRAVDILEHVPYTRTDEVLAEWVRVLAPGGTMYCQVPSAGTIFQWYVADDPRLKINGGGRACTSLYGAMWRLLGGCDDGKYVETGGDWTLNLHASMFDEVALRVTLEEAGLVVESIEENGHPNIQCVSRKPAS